MPDGFAPKPLAVLKKWQFFPDGGGQTGINRYWWSDGSTTEDEVKSHAEAISRLAFIRSKGCLKPR
jgi:hypothetical protein